MNAKEKSLELIEKFEHYSYYDGHDMTTRFQRERSNKESAIECTLIAVEEIINELQTYSDLRSILVIEDLIITVIERLEFWQEVKQELNLM